MTLVSKDDVDRRIAELATEIIARYKNKNPLFICLLRGGAPFASRLMFEITAQDPNFHPELDYMTIKTYGDERVGRASELLSDLLPTTETTNRHVILLDDVLDKGMTADFANRYMVQKHAAATVDLVVLIQKDCERPTYPQATLWGFEGPDEWLTGMGMDDARVAREANRWATHIDTA